MVTSSFLEGWGESASRDIVFNRYRKKVSRFGLLKVLSKNAFTAAPL